MTLQETVEARVAETVAPRVDPGDAPGSGFLRAGESFGPWRLVEHIADGGFGSVWRAAAIREVTTDRRRVGVGENAAVKFFAATSQDHRNRIAREVSLARRLGGHWTPEFFGADLDAIPQWAAFEFVADATLRDLVVSTGPLSADSLEVFAEDLWDALAFFRRHGVAHRDLTPRNIHVNATSAKPRVIDWGNAGDGRSAIPTAQLPRTPGYAAPEQIEGRPAGPAADLWAWGAVVCFAATGHPPLPPERYHQTIVTGDRPLDLDGVPASLMPAIDAALRWDPEDRDPDAIGAQLPGRRSHVELEEARAREADLDATLADLARRMRLRDERIEELDSQVRRYEQERLAVRSVVTRLRAAETARDEAAREVTSLRATVAQLERERDRHRERAETVDQATAALRRATIESARGRINSTRQAWRIQRLERKVDRYRTRHHEIATPWPPRVVATAIAAASATGLVRATWESRLLPLPFLFLASVGWLLSRRLTSRSRRAVDQLRACALGLAIATPFASPMLFSAGAVPSAGLARWMVEAPFITPPPPDSLDVGHGARAIDVDAADCAVDLPGHAFWDVRVDAC